MVKETDTVIIGAGLTGLVMAHQLNRESRDFIVLEKAASVGGVIHTIEKDGFTYEKGPNTGIIGNEEVPALFDDLEGKCQLEVAGNAVKKRYVLQHGKWQALPSGLWQGINTPLFTFKDKLRLLGEPFRLPGKNPNETLDNLVKRRMGKSFLDYAVDPFIIGIYAGDPSYLVPRYALPKLYNLEQNYGSFIGGSIKLAREKKKAGIISRANRKTFSVKGGLKNLVNALYDSAGREHFITNAKNLSIIPEKNRYIVKGFLNGDEISIKAKNIVTTVGAHELPNLLPFIDKNEILKISGLYYARVVQVSLGFNNWKGIPLDGFGGLIPHHEKRDILGVLFPSVFFPGRAPEGGALLSVFMGGVRRNEIYDLSDKEIGDILKNEITDLMKLPDFDPDLMEITRYEYAIPQYGADCEARFDTLENLHRLYPGLIIGGNLRNGIGMADRIKQGIDIVRNELFIK